MIGKFNTIGKEEEEAVLRVIRSGRLSGYVASKSMAGVEIESLSYEWKDFFGLPFPAVPCNSATSGLLAACMAVGVGPMDEVIVPYFTMSATACAPAVLGATIILADVEPDTFCIDPNDVGRLINENTKAVIATNMFGHPAKLKQLRSMCDSRNIKLIEDNAQAIMAKEDGFYTGTIGHIGVFSLNVHKHIQTGEGGICVTSDRDLYHGLQNAINHGECRFNDEPGLNLRMTEITAAIAREQLKKLPKIVESRVEIAEKLKDAFKSDYVSEYPTRSGCDHSYYALPLRISGEYYSKTDLLDFLRVRSPVPISAGYSGNLLAMPVSNRWLTPQRQVELAHSKSYNELSRLLLIEVCSYDIRDEHIKTIKDKLKAGIEEVL